MQVRIIRLSKSAMQSGLDDKTWCMRGIRKCDSRSHYKAIGWVSSTSMDNEIDIQFSTKHEAVRFAEDNLLEYEIIEPIQQAIPKKSYSNNFQG